ncbi:hypothetical protein [Roseisalinus antarcticus]|uniref:Uncharacterized protein n=1 Tax=Roseisalinus antarcticus TaxID=254357 RepID=A0A1Y5T5C3_9RHOB|nr:hypothetical protein [Roseisalinus antarcticus]SLN56230.1 hypothetical protein ROA7023_02539 [Roseisalinus antarcticus]
MPRDVYRSRVNAPALIPSAAFFGANLFIGLSMVACWLSLDPADFVAQFSNFLFSIMPLFLPMAAGLILSALLDWNVAPARRNSGIAL